MRQRTLLVPFALFVTGIVVASCAQKRQTTEVPRQTATATGTSTATGTGYAGSQGPGGDNGAALPQGPSPSSTPEPAPTPAPDSGPINTPDTAGFPDPTLPTNPSPPNNPPPSNWDGTADDLPATAGWVITSLDPETKVGSDGTVTIPGATDTVTPNAAAGAGGATVGYEGRVAAIINANCVNGCHVQGGTQPGTAMDTFANAQLRGARIVARANGGGMPPSPASPLNQSDIDTLKAWEAGGFQPTDGAGAAAGGNTTGQGLVLEISDQRYGNYLNDQKIVGKVGQTLKIVNKRSQGGFIIHTNGAPFDHGDVGNPIPPGGSKDYQLQSAYQGTSDVYEHTDGSVNTDRLIKLEVTP